MRFIFLLFVLPSIAFGVELTPEVPKPTVPVQSKDAPKDQSATKNTKKCELSPPPQTQEDQKIIESKPYLDKQFSGAIGSATPPACQVVNWKQGEAKVTGGTKPCPVVQPNAGLTCPAVVAYTSAGGAAAPTKCGMEENPTCAKTGGAGAGAGQGQQPPMQDSGGGSGGGSPSGGEEQSSSEGSGGGGMPSMPSPSSGGDQQQQPQQESQQQESTSADSIWELQKLLQTASTTADADEYETVVFSEDTYAQADDYTAAQAAARAATTYTNARSDGSGLYNPVSKERVFSSPYDDVPTAASAENKSIIQQALGVVAKTASGGIPILGVGANSGPSVGASISGGDFTNLLRTIFTSIPGLGTLSQTVFR